MAKIIGNDIADDLGNVNITVGASGPSFPLGTPFTKANVRSGETGTVTLTSSVKDRPQIFNATGALTVNLPSTGIVSGDTLWLYNQSTTNLMTVQASGGQYITAAYTGWIQVIALVNAPTTAANWLLVTSPSQRGEITYQHGTTYFGGNAPTITLVGGGGSLSSVNFSNFVPFLRNATWFLSVQIQVALTSATRTNAVIAINGIVNVPSSLGSSSYQISSGSLASVYSIFLGGTNQMDIVHASGSTNLYVFGGIAPLASKPTWAY
jgi:hypothetical protein